MLPRYVVDRMGMSNIEYRIKNVDTQSGNYITKDMSSKHGVFINGNKINNDTILVDGDYITIGNTSLFFTEKNFDDRESALTHYKKFGERARPTQME